MEFGRKPRLRYIPQSSAADCALACLAMVAGCHGVRLTLPQLRTLKPASARGTTIAGVMDVAHLLGFTARALRCEMEDLEEIFLPAILHWNINHYVVLEAVSKRGLKIHDPALGSRTVSWEEASPQFSGVLVELYPEHLSADRVGAQPRSWLRDLVLRSRGLGTTVAQLVLLTAVLQIFVLASPYLFQIVIDQVISTGNLAPLLPVAALFLTLAIVYAVALALRGRVIARSGASFAYQATVSVVRRLFRLPIAYFGQRETGDILSRLGSVAPMRDILVGQTGQALIDGLLSVVILIILFAYSPLLAAISLTGLALYALLSAGAVPALRRRQERMLIEKAREQTIVIESIRGIATLRLLGRETDRLNHWQNLLVRAVNAELGHAELRSLVDAGLAAIVAVENIVTLAVAAHLAVSGALSIGAVVAYFAYKTYVFSKTGELLRYLGEARMLALHADRLRDITDEAPDEAFSAPPRPAQRIHGRIELRDIWFRYTPDDPWVLRGVNLIVEAGDYVAISGVSGSGKSTLMMIALGLLPPTRGAVLVDDLELSDIGHANYRSQVIGILQADQLFSGSVRDNITFFEPVAETAPIHRSARDAAIHDDIAGMPMNYETLIGDMGSTLSGGQKQRLVLARALYHRPRVLIVDEGTAHLDSETERRVNESIAALGVTRIIFAHRAETLARATARYALDGGVLIEESCSRQAAE